MHWVNGHFLYVSFFFWPFLTYLFHPNDCQLFYSVMQLGRNDGTCVFEGCLEMCLVYDSGIKLLATVFFWKVEVEDQDSVCNLHTAQTLKLLFSNYFISIRMT